MNAEHLFWHAIGLCAQPAWMAICATALAKLVWSGELRSWSVLRLIGALFAINTLVALAWLVATQHDGRMAADATMVAATAACLGWAMRRGRR